MTRRVDPPEGPPRNSALLAAGAAFDAARLLEWEGAIAPIQGRLACEVKTDGTVVVWAGRDLQEARLAGFERLPAIALELVGASRWPGIGRAFLILGTCEVRVGLKSGQELWPEELDDRAALPAFHAVREVL